MDIDFFSQLSKINFLHRFEKKSFDFLPLFGKKKNPVMFSIVNSIRIYYRNPYQNPKGIFFQIDVENLFLRVGKNFDIHIDQKIYALSIAAIFKAIRALLPC